MTENEFLLQDRIQKIQSIDEMYDIQKNAYISFSGGKDSKVLSELIDMALPNNKIPRVFIDTGIEYKEVVNYVKSCQLKDRRITILQPKRNVKYMLDKYGYPFKNKDHCVKVAIYQKAGMNKTVKHYLEREDSFGCPKILRYQFTPEFNIKLSDQCCTKLKKEPVNMWAVSHRKSVCMTGMRRAEGGRRFALDCTVFDEGKLKKFHPLVPCSDEFLEWFISEYKVELCPLYYEPYNFFRTGCKGCPFAFGLQEQLETMRNYFPAEAKQCEILWKPIYDEYRRIGYRLTDTPE